MLPLAKLRDEIVALISSRPLALASYEFASLPDVALYTGTVIHTTDGNGGNPGLLISDGTDWLSTETGDAASNVG